MLDGRVLGKGRTTGGENPLPQKNEKY